MNQVKTDNRLQNLSYLSHAEHTKLHSIGRKHTEQTKEKIRVTSKGRPSYWKGKKLSEQTKEKIRDSKKKKPVYCVQLDKIFAGVNIAAKELSLPRCNIISCCKGKLKTCGGYHFEYQKV